MENYQCSQAVIGQLCIVSYRWLDNSIMSTIIAVPIFKLAGVYHFSGLFGPCMFHHINYEEDVLRFEE